MIAGLMTEPRSDGRPPLPPAIGAPPPLTERRRAHRRAEDRRLRAEKVLLARTLDVLAAEG